jgi:hypothetical protein
MSLSLNAKSVKHLRALAGRYRAWVIKQHARGNLSQRRAADLASSIWKLQSNPFLLGIDDPLIRRMRFAERVEKLFFADRRAVISGDRVGWDLISESIVSDAPAGSGRQAKAKRPDVLRGAESRRPAEAGRARTGQVPARLRELRPTRVADTIEPSKRKHLPAVWRTTERRHQINTVLLDIIRGSVSLSDAMQRMVRIYSERGLSDVDAHEAASSALSAIDKARERAEN